MDFNKNKLLEDDTIRRKLKDDLRNYGIKFPVFPLMMEILKPLSNIKSIIFKIENEDLLVADEIISKYKNLEQLNKEITYGTKEIINKQIVWNTKFIQFKTIAELKKQYSLL